LMRQRRQIARLRRELRRGESSIATRESQAAPPVIDA